MWTLVQFVQCHSDLSTCCSGSQGPHCVDWYFPDGLDCHSLGVCMRLMEFREWTYVKLVLLDQLVSIAVIFHNVHDDTDISERDTVYVGLYVGSGGKYSPLVEIAVVMSVFAV